jgi:hypothetical protein
VRPSDHLPVQPQDPEERIAELERQLAEARGEAEEEAGASGGADRPGGDSCVGLNPRAREVVSPAAEAYVATGGVRRATQAPEPTLNASIQWCACPKCGTRWFS